MFPVVPREKNKTKPRKNPKQKDAIDKFEFSKTDPTPAQLSSVQVFSFQLSFLLLLFIHSFIFFFAWLYGGCASAELSDPN